MFLLPLIVSLAITAFGIVSEVQKAHEREEKVCQTAPPPPGYVKDGKGYTPQEKCQEEQ